MVSDPTIFVQIASYRDLECQWTVKDLFEKADHPDRITVGICWQCNPAEDKQCFVKPSPRPAQTKIISFLPIESEGVCWARAQVQTLFRDQDYVLMIDSHMRFIQGWDTEMIAELARCRSDKPFLSNYPASYKPPDQLEEFPRPVVLRAKNFTEAGDIRFEGESLAVDPEKPLRGAFLAGGFIFAPGKFVREVPYDPYMYFDHEEITLAARAYTHGWDVYSATKTFLYHYYYTPEKLNEKRSLHWEDRKDWGIFQKASRARFNYLLAGIMPEDGTGALKNIGRYALGNLRSIREYEDFCGIDFKAKTVSEKASRSLFIEGIDRYRAAPPPVNSSLEEGSILPPLEGFSGKEGIFCILPGNFDAYVREFMNLYREKGIPLFFIAPVSSTEIGDFRKKYNIDEDIMADENRDLCKAFGFLGNIHDSPLSFILNRDRKILAIYKNRNAQNHMGDIIRGLRRLKGQNEQEKTG